MSSDDAGRGAAARGGADPFDSLRDARPVAHVSAGALRANVVPARTTGASSGLPHPLAFDAWGHGAKWVRGVLAEAGVDDAEWPGLRPDVLYGLDASAAAVRPVMRLCGRVLGTKRLLAGEGVSYGYAHRASRDTRVALVSGGYGQGIVRALGGRADVLLAGGLHRIIGRVAMDVCVVDIGDAHVRRGDEVVFFGDPARGEPAIGQWRDALGWPAAELAAAVGRGADRLEEE